MLIYKAKLKQPSRQLRDNMTDAERRLWAKLRLNQLEGRRFYRQRPIGDYIVDFFSPRAKLVIEVDGGRHFCEGTIEYDRIRDEYLSSRGFRVLRFTNTDVLKNTDGVIERMRENL